MNAHVEIMHLIIGYTIIGVFVASCVAAVLDLFNYIKLESSVRKKLQAIILLEVATICVGYFYELVKFNPAPIIHNVNTAQAEVALSKAQLQTTNLVSKPLSRISDEVDPPIEASRKPVSSQLKAAVKNMETFAPGSIPNMGWIFLGHLNTEKTEFTSKSGQTTDGVWPIKADDELTIKDDVYVRALTTDVWHSTAPIISVARAGEKIKVLEVQLNAAKIGGSYVWVKASIGQF